MLWVSSVMAAALGQVRIKVRNCAIAAAARGVSMAVRAPVIRKHASPLVLYSYAKTSKDYATGTVAGMHTRSLGRNRGTYSGAGPCGAASVLSQCERDLLNMRDQASDQLTREESCSHKKESQP